MKVRVECHYQPAKTSKKFELLSEWLRLEEALQLVEDLEKTGRLKEVVFYDQQESSWTKKEILRFLKQLETEPQDVIAYIDGGYDRETKKAGIGVAIYYEQHHSHWRRRFNDCLELLQDNNEAEYAALYRCIQELESMDVARQEVTIYLDSMIVANQAAGEWPCYEEHYIAWLERIEQLSKKLDLILHYQLIDRNQNKEADSLAGQALSGIQIESTIERSSRPPKA
ncbi:reverse transcriptase-like protein [Alkalihalobacillus oceani]|uniref:reverse transcriptase-like protein n=1 Tax=Halalkalibacter oceani TaxID=1653776 RepID=UPI0020408FF6|nr:reverse transcriptase-like protein [Halalkalibacter oceani]MCM3760712.1 reverse transcriptase-like protein [Halalkalibacter oceani]